MATGALCRKPGYWAVLPAKVRYDEELRPNAKLIYAEITALADSTGFCWAKNKYLSELFGLSKKTVSDLIGRRKAIYRSRSSATKKARFQTEKSTSTA